MHIVVGKMSLHFLSTTTWDWCECPGGQGDNGGGTGSCPLTSIGSIKSYEAT